MKKLMHILARLFPYTATGENPTAVRMFYRMSIIKEFFLKTKRLSKGDWPRLSGNYKIIDPNGQIAICTLTSEIFTLSSLNWNNVAIIGKVYTPNLGIERIILNIITNPHIRYLVLCGRDSSVFQPGQAIKCLFQYGINSEKRIKKAVGHFPVLNNLPEEKINTFLHQVELIDYREEIDMEMIYQKVSSLKIKKDKFIENGSSVYEPNDEQKMFTPLKAGGRRIPLDYDERGFFVITTDLTKKVITVKHYYKDNHPGFIIEGHSYESILLAILEKGLISQMSHAGYLGEELAKAEVALKLNLRYEQDQPLRRKG